MAKKSPVIIKPPNVLVIQFLIEGTVPYVQNKFSAKAQAAIHEKHASGAAGKTKKNREAKDFKQNWADAIHKSRAGWCGIPAAAFRAALVSTCRLVDLDMSRAKLCLFVEADGEDADDGTPLVKITKGKPQYAEHPVRNASGVIDLRARPMWMPGWQALLTIRYDADIFKPEYVANLVQRAGQQVGIGEGRPDSKKSTGVGWGLFGILNNKGRKRGTQKRK